LRSARRSACSRHLFFVAESFGPHFSGFRADFQKRAR
jgi:hypothetical protein